MDCDRVVKEIEERLPEIARGIIQTNARLPEEQKQRFLQDPDAIEEHEPCWHQWGIITHSRKFREVYDNKTARQLKEWGIEEQLEQEIDGQLKAELIRIAMPLHDLGKFKKGASETAFTGHDKISEEIILSKEFREVLKKYGLTQAQTEYIARCAGNHYELGCVRAWARKTKGYTIQYTQSQEFAETIQAQLQKYRGFEAEIGVLFLTDSLAKTDVTIKAETDEEINKNTPEAEQEIIERGLNPELIHAVRQTPVNIAVAREYLRAVSKY